MELVQGLPITDYCDDKRLSTRERLQLFAKVCRAVQHAHQKGIIHRDLKPSNVLVAQIDSLATPKVIDFGVAKAVSQKLTEQSVYTQFSQMIGTPLYMSPEQAAMGVVDIDTRSDVYSLGALLYELLTGNTPFDRESVKQFGFDELRRVIREDEPRRPSDAISTLHAQALSTVADRRHCDPRKLSNSLKGELDWLVMKSLEKDRNRRYESPNAMAADIDRYLNNEPIAASPPSTVYRCKKLCQRHRGRLLTASFLAVLLLVSGAVAVRGKLQKTRVQRQVSQEVEQSVAAARTAIEIGDLAAARQRIGEASGRLVAAGHGLTELTETVEQLVAEVDARYEQRQRFARFQKLSRGVLYDEAYDTQETTHESIPALREALNVYAVLGDDHWYEHLNDTYLTAQQQNELHETVYALLVFMADYNVRWPDVRNAEAAQESLEYLRWATLNHEPTRAFYFVRSECHKFLKNTEKADQDQESFLQAKAVTAFDYYMPGHTAGWRGDREEEIRSYEAALRIQPNHFNSLFFLAMRLSSEGRKTEAAQLYRACLAVRPNHVPTLRNRAILVMETGENEEALELTTKAIEIGTTSPIAYAVRGYIYAIMGQQERALRDFDEALRLDALGGSTDTATKMNIFDYRAEILYRTQQYDKALDDLNAAVQLAAELANKDSEEVVFNCFTNRARVLSTVERHAEALADIDEALRMAASSRLKLSSKFIAGAHTLRGKILLQTQRSDEALSELDQALSLAPDSELSLISEIACHRAQAFHNLGQFTEAAQELSRVIECRAEKVLEDWAASSLAWLLANCPDLSVRDIPRALELASQAVEREPNNGNHWNTLGVAQYRAADLTAAIESLTQSLRLGDAGQAENLLFLAMAHSQLGQPDQAREWYAKAAALDD